MHIARISCIVLTETDDNRDTIPGALATSNKTARRLMRVG